MTFIANSRQFFEFLFKYRRKLRFLCEKNIWERRFQSNQTPKSIDVLFFGTDRFSLSSLKALVGEQRLNQTVRRLAVVTSFKSSSNPVRKSANAENLHCIDWPISNDVCRMYDLGVVVSFGHLIPEPIISSLPLGMINVHASLLPRWRGAAPIIYALKNGDSKTGVTVMRILPKRFDIGEILAQKEVPVSGDCLMPELHDTLSNEGADLLVDCLRDIDFRLENAQQQNPDHVTYAPKVTPALAQVNWNTSALEVYNLYRALYSYKPLATRWNGLNVKLVEIKCSTSEVVNAQPAVTIEYSKLEKCLKVTCGNGHSVCVYKLGLEGKRVMSAADFFNGFLSKITGKSYFE